MEQKKYLAFEVVKLLWGEAKAKDAEKSFEHTFQERAPEFNIKVSLEDSLAKTIIPFTPRNSMSNAKELIKQKAVDVNGETVSDPNYKLKINDKIKVGDRTFLKVAK